MNAALTAAEQGKTYITEDDVAAATSNFQIVTWNELDPTNPDVKNKLSPERLNNN